MRETPKSDMPGNTGKPAAAPTQAGARQDRLKAALKANMGRRKAQARARTGDVPDEKNKG
ncbi:hypothetical protein LHP98_09390 [Rhodobacter sp. Har01]|uniref:hypothetical protein n=1 Tax=Rhodobacter sp. Har01 TaxID=2883999 RepID=UPI001D063ADF|nr:hypothetical protein [Rhodobacter sp. Har01]MCB6178343.1 hypothetical protein [Rhodobacter sp. Har01]